MAFLVHNYVRTGCILNQIKIWKTPEYNSIFTEQTLQYLETEIVA